MQFNVEQGDLARALEHVLGVVDKRGTMPILAHCLVEADDQGFAVSATDLELSFKGRFPAEVQDSGTFAVLAHAFHGLVKNLPKGTLRITGDEKQVKVEAGDSVYKFLTLPAEQFPPLPSSRGASLAPVETQAFLDLTDKTSFSMSGDDLQYNLASTFWERREVDGNFHLRMVSTDGHRLSLAEQAQPELARLEWTEGILVPAKAVREIKRFVEYHAKNGSVNLGFEIIQKEYKDGEGVTRAKPKIQTLFLQTGDKELSTRLLDRKFPEYQRIIPESCEHRFIFNRQELAAALKRVSLLSTDRFRGVVITLNNGTAELAHDNPEVGAGREVVKIMESTSAKKATLTFVLNARYLLEPLVVMKGETVVMEVNDVTRPVRLLDASAPGSMWLVMPMDL
jgi:DNA polymerase-3 subunit beta